MDVIEKDPKFYKYFAKYVVKAFVRIVYHPKYIGVENIPKDGRIVLAGNHTNNLDCILIIASSPRVVHFMAKDSLYKGFKKHLFKHMGIIPVNRKIKDKDCLITAKNFLNKDLVIGIFPEGTINRTDDTIMPFKIGAVKMAHDTNSKIVPFIIKGKYKFFRNGLRITYLKPIEVKDDILDNDNEKLMKIIKKNLEDEEV
jgi:1-acyl-sn-glycerol-3-phosphate acyltransferase